MPGLPCPLPWEEAPAGPGAVRAMPTSFTVVPVEAQGEERGPPERDGQRQEEKDDDERDRGSGERAGGAGGSARGQRWRFVCGERGCCAGRAGSPPEGPCSLWKGRIASPQRPVPGLPVQVETCTSGEGESPAPEAAESLFLSLSVSRRRWLKGGSVPGRRSGAARGRARRLPGVVWGGLSASRLQGGCNQCRWQFNGQS